MRIDGADSASARSFASLRDPVDPHPGPRHLLDLGPRLTVLVEQRLALRVAQRNLPRSHLPAGLDPELRHRRPAIDLRHPRVHPERRQRVDDDLRVHVRARQRNRRAVTVQQVQRRQPPSVRSLSVQRPLRRRGRRRRGQRLARLHSARRLRREGRRSRRLDDVRLSPNRHLRRPARRRDRHGDRRRDRPQPPTLQRRARRRHDLRQRPADQLEIPANPHPDRAGQRRDHSRPPRRQLAAAAAHESTTHQRRAATELRRDQRYAAQHQQRDHDRPAPGRERRAHIPTQRILRERHPTQRCLGAHGPRDPPGRRQQRQHPRPAPRLHPVRTPQPQRERRAQTGQDHTNQVHAPAQRADHRLTLRRIRRPGQRHPDREQRRDPNQSESGQRRPLGAQPATKAPQ